MENTTQKVEYSEDFKKYVFGKINEEIQTYYRTIMQMDCSGNYEDFKDADFNLIFGQSKKDIEAKFFKELETPEAKQKTFLEQKELPYFIPTWDNKPPFKEPIVKLNGQSILSFQNLTCLLASQGSGKSSVMESIVSAVVNPQADNLFFTTTAQRVLYIDFERTETDVWNSFNRVMLRSKVIKGTEVNTQKIASLRRIPNAKSRKQTIEDLIKDFKPELLLLDGVGDLVDDTNSLPEAIECKVWVREITAKYNLSIITTLHPNKGTKIPRGHIGSEMLRECENVLIIQVNGDESRTITTDFEHGKARNSGKAEASFIWNDEVKMFIGTDTVKTQGENIGIVKPEPDDLSYDLWQKVLVDCFSKKASQKHSELLISLQLAIKSIAKKKFSQTLCKTAIVYLINLELIETKGTPKTRSLLYFFNPPIKLG
jgi:hypothetical protein